MKIITLKYPGKCRECGERMPRGTVARWHGRGDVTCNPMCNIDDDYVQREITRRENNEYAQGKAEAERYLSDVAIYGRELAEAWERDAELARFNRGEE